MSITCTITRAGRFDEYGRPLTVSQSYTGSYSFVKDLVRSGYASVADENVFDDDNLPNGQPAPNVAATINPLTGKIKKLGSTEDIMPGMARPKPVLIVGGDHAYKQWIDGNGGMLQMYKDAGINPYIAVNGSSVGGINTLSWSKLKDTGAEITNHGWDHPLRWTGDSGGGGASTGVDLYYVGANASGTIAIDSTNVTLVSATEGTTTLALATYSTLAAMVAAIDALAGWNCTLSAELIGTEASNNLLQIAAVTVTKSSTVSKRVCAGGGIHVFYAGTAYKTVQFRKVGTTFAVFVDGVSVASFDLANVLYDTIDELVAAIKALACFSGLSSSVFELFATKGNVSGGLTFMSGAEKSASLSDFPLIDCKRYPLYMPAGLSVQYIARRQLLKNHSAASAGGVTFESAMQSGGAWFEDLTRDLMDIYPISRGASRERFVSPKQMPAKHNSPHVFHQDYFSRQKTAFTNTGDTITLGTSWALSNYTEAVPVVFSGASLPSPLVAGTWYFAKTVSGDTLKVSATAGGAAITLTTNGSGFIEIPIFYAARHTKAIVDALVDTAKRGSAFVACGLMHKLLPDGSSPYGITSDDNYHDQTEADWYAFTQHAKGFIDSGDLIPMTMIDWMQKQPLFSAPQNLLFNPGFKNAGDDMTKIITDDNGVNIPGWSFKMPANWSAASINDAGELVYTQTSATAALPMYQDLMLDPGTYDISCTVTVDAYTAGGTASLQYRCTNGADLTGSSLVSQTVAGQQDGSVGAAQVPRSVDLRARITVPEPGFLPGRVWSTTGPFDLSANYNIKVEIDSKGSTADIDCRGATPAATTAAELADKINAGIKATAAYAGYGEYHAAAKCVGNRVVIETPTRPVVDGAQQVVIRAGTSLSALATIFKAGGVSATGTCVGFGVSSGRSMSGGLFINSTLQGTGRISNPKIVKI